MLESTHRWEECFALNFDINLEFAANIYVNDQILCILTKMQVKLAIFYSGKFQLSRNGV